MTNEERRKYPRVEDEGLSLKLESGDFDAITHTLNISESGIYCKVNREIPLMSHVKVVLMVPDLSAGDKITKGVELSGVVVREHPVIIDGKIRHYDIAIFFNDLSPKDRQIIASYISRKKG